MRIVVLVVALASAFAGALLSGREGALQVDPEPSDAALFV